MMTDKEILIQLLYSNHLEPKEVERAKVLIHLFKLDLENRRF